MMVSVNFCRSNAADATVCARRSITSDLRFLNSAKRNRRVLRNDTPAKEQKVLSVP